MMRVHSVFLVHIDLKEFVVRCALVVLKATSHYVSTSLLTPPKHLRVQFLEIGIDEPLLGYFHEGLAGLGEVALAFKRAVVDLLDELDCESHIIRVRRIISRSDGAFLGVLGPCYEGAELAFVGEGAVLVGFGVGAAED